MTTATTGLQKLLSIPRLGLRTALTLIQALKARALADPPPNIEKAAARMYACGESLQRKYADKALAAPVDNTVAVEADRASNLSVSALSRRLSAYTLLDPARYPNAARAAELLERLFPDGLSFVMLPFAQQYAHVDTMLKLIDQEQLAPDLERLAGSDFMTELRSSQVQYRAALDKSATPSAEQADLHEAVREAAEVIGDYALQVVASCDTSQPESVAAARAALQPIEDLRADQSRRSRTSKRSRQPQSTDPEAI